MAEKIVNVIMQLSGNYTDLKQLASYLRENEDIIVKWGSGTMDNILQYLDPQQHSLGFLWILNFKSQLSIGDVPAFFSQVDTLIKAGDRNQLAMTPSRLVTPLRKVFDEANKLKQPQKALSILKTAVQRLRPSVDTLTPFHPLFLMACIQSKNYKAAVNLLEQDILYVEGGGASAKDLMLYGYYGGMVYISQKKFAQAVKLLEITLTVPAMALSAIMVESYKKYILASLLSTGTVETLPKHTSSIVSRNMKLCCIPYLELANAFATHDQDEVNKVLSVHQAVYQKDKNLGLTLQVAAYVSRLNVKRLTKTYLTLSSADIAKMCKLKTAKEAEEVVAKMAYEGEVYATINQKDGMISFYEPAQQYNDAAFASTMDKHFTRSIWLQRQLRGLDERIQTSSSYLQKVIGERHGPGDAGDLPDRQPGMSQPPGRS